jgi:hypothetical protein
MHIHYALITQYPFVFLESVLVCVCCFQSAWNDTVRPGRMAVSRQAHVFHPLFHRNLAKQHTENLKKTSTGGLRTALQGLCRHRHFQHGIMALILIDLALIITALLLESFYPGAPRQWRPIPVTSLRSGACARSLALLGICSA